MKLHRGSVTKEGLGWAAAARGAVSGSFSGKFFAVGEWTSSMCSLTVPNSLPLSSSLVLGLEAPSCLCDWMDEGTDLPSG